MDDINNLGQDNNNTHIADKICQAFELVSGTILIHNRMMMVLGLGSWVSHGVLVTPIFVATIAATVAAYWDLVAAGVERVLLEWAACRLPTLCQWAKALESFALSKAWHLVQILSMSAVFATMQFAISCGKATGES
jgi:hypothetical protein